MARISWTTCASAIALCVFSIGVLSGCSRRDNNPGSQKPLWAHVLRDGSVEIDGQRYETVKDLQTFLHERKPLTVIVSPAKETSYMDTARAMTAIQGVGDIDVVVVGHLQGS